MQLCPIHAHPWLLDPRPWHPSCSHSDEISVTTRPLVWAGGSVPLGSLLLEAHPVQPDLLMLSTHKAGPGTPGPLDGIPDRAPALLVEGQNSQHFQGFDQCIINTNHLMIALSI